MKQVISLNPNEAGFWADYADDLSAAGENTEALRAYRRAIELNPSMEDFHVGLAEVLLKSGRLSDAESEYRAALSIYDAQYKKGQPTDEYHSFAKGLVKIEAEHGEEVLLAENRMKLAHVLLLEKKYDEALLQTKAALEADHNEFAAFYLQAEIYDAKGDHVEAEKMRKNADLIIRRAATQETAKSKTALDVDPRVLFLSDSLWNTQSGDPAFPAEIVSILEPRSTSLSSFERVQLASAYFALGRVMAGKEQWEKAITSDTKLDNAVSHHNLGQQLLKSGAPNDALTHLRRAYELDPQNATFRMDYDTVRQPASSGRF
jgi:tetratricopeptide (TPR) repeat protein